MHASLASNVASTSRLADAEATPAYQDGATVKVYVNPAIRRKRRWTRASPSRGCFWASSRFSGASRITSRRRRLGGQQSACACQRRSRSRQKSAPAGPPMRLAGLIRNQILADFDSGVHQPARFAVHGNGVVGLVADRIGLVVADHEIALGAQRFSSSGGRSVSR